MAVVMACGLVGTEGAGIEEKCGADFQKVVVCLSYATGKAATPTKECCESVKGIKEKDPECLCYIMLQTHKGNDQIKSMGIQEAKLLQLPSACALQNASLTDCPSNFTLSLCLFVSLLLSLFLYKYILSLSWDWDGFLIIYKYELTRIKPLEMTQIKVN